MRLHSQRANDRARPAEEAAELAREGDPGDSRWNLMDGALIAAAFFVCLSPGSALAQLVVVEPGFTVTTLPPGVGAKGIECSPGGIWGDYVYVGDSSGGTIEIGFGNRSGEGSSFEISLRPLIGWTSSRLGLSNEK